MPLYNSSHLIIELVFTLVEYIELCCQLLLFQKYKDRFVILYQYEFIFLTEIKAFVRAYDVKIFQLQK
jgi:hypothetical protein